MSYGFQLGRPFFHLFLVVILRLSIGNENDVERNAALELRGVDESVVNELEHISNAGRTTPEIAIKIRNPKNFKVPVFIIVNFVEIGGGFDLFELEI